LDDDFYQALRTKVRTWLAGKGKAFTYADVLLVGPDLLHLLFKLSVDPRIPLTHKAQLAAAIAYFVSPFDLIPEGLIGPGGFLDDIALSAYVLHRVINAGHGSVAEEHWAGDGQLLHVLQRILEIADRALGTGLWNRLKRLVARG
jgi:uncharacterized membrane protein YkvA (DUF1232 family)